MPITPTIYIILNHFTAGQIYLSTLSFHITIVESNKLDSNLNSANPSMVFKNLQTNSKLNF